MTELTPQKIMEIHDCIIDRYGGTKGILNIGTIEYRVYQLNKKIDVFEKAILALHNIITDNPFMDGHKRTGFQIADLILREEGYHIHGGEEETLAALLKIAEYKCTVKEIEKWIKQKSQKIKGTQLQLG
jgi:death-on-curing protein